MKTLLIVTDFSAGAAHAAEYGYHLAQQLKADVILCNAVLIPSDIPQAGMVAWPVDNYDSYLDSSTNQLEVLKDQLEISTEKYAFKPAISCITNAGHINDLVLELIGKNEIAFVVMGTHGSDGLSTFVMGNHSRSMIDQITRPLLLVPPKVSMKPVRKIIFAADFKNAKDDLITFYALILLAKTLKAEILLTHIYKENQNSSDDNDWVKESLTNLAVSSNYPDISFKYLQSDNIEEELQALCDQEAADILAMIHQPHGFIDSLLHRSHSQYMANHSSIPLLIFPG